MAGENEELGRRVDETVTGFGGGGVEGESKGVYYFRTSFCGGHQIHQLLEGQRVNAESPSLVTAFTD